MNDDYETALSVARQQIENGAQIIDINMDEGLLDSEMAMEKFFEDCEVDDEYAVYLTGRYSFTDNTFFDIMESNPGCDFYGKNDGTDQYFTGCFAMKKKYMIDWLNKTDWDHINSNMINFEQTLWDYVKDNNLFTCELKDMGMECNVFGAGTPQVLVR